MLIRPELAAYDQEIGLCAIKRSRKNKYYAIVVSLS